MLGAAHRVFAPGTTLRIVDASSKAFDVWSEKGVKGRTLVLFDNYPHSFGYKSYLKDNNTPALTANNFVEYAIFSNVVRKVYLVVPEENWEEFRTRKEIGAIGEVPGLQRGLYLFLKSGITFIAVTPSALPAQEEPVLVYNNERLFDLERTLELLKRRGLTSDLVVSLRGAHE